MPKARFLAALLALLLAAVAAAPVPAAGPAEAPDAVVHESSDCAGETCAERKIVIRHRSCDGDDCGAQPRVVFLGKGGHAWRHGDHPFFAWGGGYLGVELTDLTPELRTHFGVPEDAGVLVARVADGSPAAIAGLAAGDIISAVSGEPVASAAALARQVRGRDEGEQVDLEVWRDGRVETFPATLEGRDADGLAERLHRMIEVRCGDDEDCRVDLGAAGIDCGGEGEECELTVRCDDDGCTCTANGEERDCSELPGLHVGRR